MRGATIERVVPGITVERITTICPVFLVRIACPISDVTVSMASRAVAPLGLLGVPTHTIDRSVSVTACKELAVAVRRPPSTFRLTSSSISRSRIGECPDRIKSTFISDRSRPTTVWPRSARQAQQTVPTYPSPNTLIFIVPYNPRP